MIEFFKFFSIVATAVFGIYGSLVDFRGSDRQITKEGWIGLVGVVASATVLATLQIYSDVQDE